MITLLAAAALLLAESQAPPQEASAEVKVDSLIGGVLPADQEWKPMTGQARWKLFWIENFMTPGVYFRPSFPALFKHLDNDPESWRQGAKGYGRRYASEFGAFTVRGAMEAGLAAAMKYEPRYVRCKCSGALARTKHAVSWTFLTYNESGQKRLGLPRILSNYAAPVVADRWRPSGERDPWKAARSGTTYFYYGSFFNVLAEFLPEIKRLIHLK